MSIKRKKRVLAIDDEPAMTEWLKILLEHAGYEVRTALIGTRGEELFKTWRPDAVVPTHAPRRRRHRLAGSSSTRPAAS
jgi:DNA-binding NtrC family response regulator